MSTTFQSAEGDLVASRSCGGGTSITATTGDWRFWSGLSTVSSLYMHWLQNCMAVLPMVFVYAQVKKKRQAVDGRRRTHPTFFSLPTFKENIMSLLNTRSNILQFKWGLVDAPKTNSNDTSNEDIVKKTVETFNKNHQYCNVFTDYFFARLQRIRWASKLPKSFTDDAIEHVLNWQKDQGYMEENPDRSAEEAIKPFFERYNFLSYDAELGRRRDACNRGYIDYEYVKQPRYDTYVLSNQVDKKTLDINGRNVAGAARQLSRDKINTNISSQVRDRLNMQVRNISKSYRDMQGKVRYSRSRFT